MKKLLVKMSDEGFKHLYTNKDSFITGALIENKLTNLIVDAIAIGEKELELKIRKINNGKASRKKN
tara:strand:- start:21 stop:218 length:198 start_codon:yes stop_codon:yes gene_type:complete